jgi:hypothetical protein
MLTGIIFLPDSSKNLSAKGLKTSSDWVLKYNELVLLLYLESSLEYSLIESSNKDKPPYLVKFCK